jgi:uncharacterized protein (DUF2267 family)
MSLTGLEVFDESVQTTSAWLKEITELLGPHRHRAYQSLRAVLRGLRDRLTIDEAVQLGAQLPMLVRGIYEAWDPTGKPEKVSLARRVPRPDQRALGECAIDQSRGCNPRRVPGTQEPCQPRRDP